MRSRAAGRAPQLCYPLMGVYCVATTCHLPEGIFTQVSVQRRCSLNGLPDCSVPLPFHPPRAIAVLPNTVIRMSSYAALLYLRVLISSSVLALSSSWPSEVVARYLSEIAAAIMSGL